jgi:hypothetical protein
MAMTLTTSRGQSSRAQEEPVSGLTRSAEQEEWRKTVRAFFEQKSPGAEVRRLMETPEGYDPAVWSQMSDQLGIQGLASRRSTAGRGTASSSWRLSSKKRAGGCCARPCFHP